MKYSIMHIDDRAKNNISKNKEILKNFEYVDIEYFNGKDIDGRPILQNLGILLDNWSPYDGRTFSPLPGEYGVWISTIYFFDYMIKNKIDQMILFEDDIVLSENFVDDFYKIANDLPDDFDFLSLSYPVGQNELDDSTKINSEYIHRSINQYANAQGILYTLSGAKKVIKLLKRKGLEYTSDCFIFRQSRLKLINGFSLIPEKIKLIYSDENIKSVIDPNNLRRT